jgi:hypothetical protein
VDGKKNKFAHRQWELPSCLLLKGFPFSNPDSSFSSVAFIWGPAQSLFRSADQLTATESKRQAYLNKGQSPAKSKVPYAQANKKWQAMHR